MFLRFTYSVRCILDNIPITIKLNTMNTLNRNLNIISAIFILTLTSLVIYNIITYGVINYISFNGI